MFRRMLCLFLFAMPVHAQEFIPAKFEFRVIPPAAERHTLRPDLELRVTYAGPMLQEQTRVFSFQLYDQRQYQSASEIRDYRTTQLGELIEGISDLFNTGDDVPPILVPRTGLGKATERIAGVENDAEGKPRYVEQDEWQVRVSYPQEEETDFSFRIEYESVYFGLAPGWCYINGESAGTDRPKGAVFDDYHWWEWGRVKTYRIELDPETWEPTLRAVGYDTPFHMYRIPAETKRPGAE